MEKIIELLPEQLIVVLFFFLIVVIIALVILTFIALRKGREIKLGPISFGKEDLNGANHKQKGKDPSNNQISNDDVSWSIVEGKIKELKENLIADQYFPSLIIGVGRGGAVVGALLSGCLGSIPLVVIDRIYKWGDNGREDSMLISEIDLSNYNEKVLIVAGELHTGNTAKLYIEHIKASGAKAVKMFVLFKEKYPSFQPNYFGFESDFADIKLPWMITKEYKRQSLEK